MKLVLVFLLACFAGSTATPLFSGVDLMAMKKQEDERRKKAPKSKVKVTDANVTSVAAGNKKYGFVQMESNEPLPEEGGEELPPVAEKKREDATKQPDFWKKQQNEIEQRIAKLRQEIEQSQLDLNKLWSDFYIKNIAAEQEAIRLQIAQLTNQIEQKRLFLSQSETQLEELMEKARKAGVPPGWLR